MAEKEYIEREAAIEAAIDAADEWDGGYNPHRAVQIRDGINAIHAADVRPVVRGKWDDKPVAFFLKCSECGCCVANGYDVFLDRGELNYCPNCGADMKEKS